MIRNFYLEMDRPYSKNERFLLHSIFLFAILYVSFFVLGGSIIWGCYCLFISFWTVGNKYDLPTPAISVLLLGSILLVVKMFQSLYAVQRFDTSSLKEIAKEDEPQLFQLIAEIAESMRIPVPKRVYLSRAVSASVFFKAGFWNAFFPGKKNLEIGMGLINVLNKEELRAVLAHEFGHFSQESMALGGPVYVIGQSVQYLIRKVEIKKRGTFEDQYYAFVTIFRMLVESLFSKLSKQYVAFSEELEFDADRVAVKYVGKEALVSALLKVTFATDMLDETLKSTEIMVRSEKGVSDLYVAYHCMVASFLHVKQTQWRDGFINEKLVGINLSRLSRKRIEMLRFSSCASTVLQDEPVLSRDLLVDFADVCVEFTRNIYLNQLNVDPNRLLLCSLPSYQKWILNYFQQQEGRVRVESQIAEVEIILTDHLHVVPLVDWFFEVYLNESKLGKGYFRKGFSLKRKLVVGEYSLAIKGALLKDASFPVIVENAGTYKVWMDYKLHFWKAEYVFFIKKVDFSV